jgi:hypothetical protein
MALVLALLPILPLSGNRRQKTPSMENRQPKLILAWFSANNHPPNHNVGAMISTESFFDARQRLLLGNHATVVQINHPPDHICLPPSLEGQQLWHCRHHIRAQERQTCTCPLVPQRLIDIFPLGEGAKETRFACSAGFEELPSSPWPLTLEGKTVNFLALTARQGRSWPFPSAQSGVYRGCGNGQIDYEWRDRQAPMVMTDAILRRRAKRI